MVTRFLFVFVITSGLSLCSSLKAQTTQTTFSITNQTTTPNSPQKNPDPAPKKRDKPGVWSSSLTALLGIPDSQLGPINLVLNSTPHILHKTPQLLLKSQFKVQFQQHVLGKPENQAQQTITKDFAAFFSTMLIPMNTILEKRDIPWSTYLNLCAGLLNLGETSREKGSLLTKSIIPVFLAYEQTKSLIKRLKIVRRLVREGKITTGRSIPQHMQDQEYLVFQSHFGYLLRMFPQLVHNYDAALRAAKSGVETTKDFLTEEWTRILIKKGYKFTKDLTESFLDFYTKWRGFDSGQNQAPKEPEQPTISSYYEDNLFKYVPRIEPYLDKTIPSKIDEIRSYTRPADKQLRDQYLACALLALPVFPHCYMLQSDYDQLSQDDQIAIASFAFEDWSFTLKLLVNLGCLFGAGIEVEQYSDLA